MDRPPTSSRSEFTPTSAEELARFVADNAAGDRRPLIPCGGRTALHFGGAVPDEATLVSLSELQNVIDYPARDMTVTVEAGHRIDELQRLLAAEGQRLPIDVPLAHRATLGGAVATNTSGPGRFGHGTFRDYVIGISAVDGQGRLFSAGGRVVKNVAGYDLCKLLVGSLGTLATITQVTLKLRPAPHFRRLLWATLDSSSAIESSLDRLVTTATRPVAIEVLNAKAAWQVHGELRRSLPIDHPVLVLGFEGGDRETLEQIDTARQELSGMFTGDAVTLEAEDAESLWQVLTEYQAASDDPVSFQASVRPSQLSAFVKSASDFDVAVQCHAGTGVVIGHLPDRCSTAADVAPILSRLRELAVQSAGSLVIHSCDADWKAELSVFGPPPADAPLMSRIKSMLDPHDLLNPGRLTFTSPRSDATSRSNTSVGRERG